MKKALLILMLPAAAVAAMAQKPITSLLSREQQSAIETAIQEEMKISSTPGASVAIINNNQVVYEKWFGKANSLTKASLTDSTIFQIGSVTKIFTSLALLSELNKAGISPHDPIGGVIKGLSPGLSRLTYHQLLSHTSGMADYWPSPGECNLEVYPFFQQKGDSVLFAKPGTVFSYCNIGYALAGLALEKLTNKRYPDAIGDIILKPLNLNNTTFDFLSVACKSFSAGHVLDPGNGKAMPYILDVSCPLVQAAGGLYTNIRDLERFATFLMNKGALDDQQLFDKKIIELISGRYAVRFTLSNSPYGFLSYPNNAYGYGIFTLDYGNSRLTGNIGIASQMTYFMLVPEKKFALILVSNLQMDMLVNSFQKIYAVVLGEPERPAGKVGLDNAESKAIAGSYLMHAIDSGNDATAVITDKDGRLFIRLPGDEDRELSRTGVMEYRFITPGSRLPNEILFEKDPSGAVRYMRYAWTAWEKVD